MKNTVHPPKLCTLRKRASGKAPMIIHIRKLSFKKQVPIGGYDRQAIIAPRQISPHEKNLANARFFICSIQFSLSIYFHNIVKRLKFPFFRTFRRLAERHLRDQLPFFGNVPFVPDRLVHQRVIMLQLSLIHIFYFLPQAGRGPDAA